MVHGACLPLGIHAWVVCAFFKVARDGSYSKPPHAKLKYGTMIAIRAGIIGAGASALSKAVTIAVRYRCGTNACVCVCVCVDLAFAACLTCKD